MSAYTSSAQVVNATLEAIAAQKQITSLSDGSTAAKAANVVYAPTVQLVLRALDPDFARTTTALVLSGNTAPVPWTYEYIYLADCVRLRQVRPASGAYNAMDPQPVRANVAFDVTGTLKVICTNQINALAVYTTSNVTESQWDSVFADAVVRRLANPLAMALSGRPDFARELLDEASRVAAIAEAVDENVIRT